MNFLCGLIYRMNLRQTQATFKQCSPAFSVCIRVRGEGTVFGFNTSGCSSWGSSKCCSWFSVMTCNKKWLFKKRHSSKAVFIILKLNRIRSRSISTRNESNSDDFKPSIFDFFVQPQEENTWWIKNWSRFIGSRSNRIKLDLILNVSTLNLLRTKIDGHRLRHNAILISNNVPFHRNTLRHTF